MEQGSHRAIEQFGLEGTLRDHPVLTPCSEQGHLHLSQAAQSHIQPGMSQWKGHPPPLWTTRASV